MSTGGRRGIPASRGLVSGGPLGPHANDLRLDWGSVTSIETRASERQAPSNGDSTSTAGIAAGYDPDPTRSMSLRADAYIEPHWLEIEQREIFARSWQWVCHVESLREPGSYLALEVAGMPVALVRGGDGELRAFYNVCQHRAHELLAGSGRTDSIVCPYHGWTYELTGRLAQARRTADVAGFDVIEHLPERG